LLKVQECSDRICCEEVGLVGETKTRSADLMRILENLEKTDLGQEIRVEGEKPAYSSENGFEKTGPERPQVSSRKVQSPSACPQDARAVVDVRYFHQAPS